MNHPSDTPNLAPKANSAPTPNHDAKSEVDQAPLCDISAREWQATIKLDSAAGSDESTNLDLSAWTLQAMHLLTEATADLLRGDRPESSFEQLFCRIMEHLNCEFFANYDFVDGRLQLVCSAGFTSEMTDRIRVLRPGEMLCGATSLEHDLLYLPSTHAYSHPESAALQQVQGTAFVGLPLRDRGELVGTLSFVTTRRGSFTREELNFLRTLRNTVAAAKARYRDTQALVRSEARYRAVTETCLDGLIVVDGEGTIRDVNAAYLSLSGFDISELVGRSLCELSSDCDQQRLLSALAASTKENKVHHQCHHKRSDGSCWPIELTFSRVPDQQVAYFVVVKDLTERVESERSLRESEERIRAAIEQTRIVLWEANPFTSDFHYVIGPGETLLGYSNDEWLAPGFWQSRLHPDDREWAKRFCELATHAHRDHRFEYRMVHRDGHVVWVEEVASVVDEEGRVTASRGALLDVTARKQIEEQLNQARKLEAIGRLAGGVAHDFNNMLTVISGYTELLIDSLSASDPRGEWVQNLKAASERAARLTDQLLLFSRSSTVGRRAWSVNEILEGSLELLKRLIGDDIELDVSLADTETFIEVDRSMLEQIILNLVINARDAMPTGGTVDVRTRVTQRPASVFEVDTEEALLRGPMVVDGLPTAGADPVPCIELTVKDHGCGMNAEQLAKVFEPFYTTKEVGRGTGLGMAVVYGATKQNGGAIEIESQVEGGTTVRVLFRGIEAEAFTCSAAPAELGVGCETILLVEDEPQVRDLARLSLQQQGYCVMTAANAAEAFEVAGDEAMHIDCLVTDVVMAGMGGRQLADRLREQRPGIRVLYISGYTDDEILRHGVAEGTDHFLRKPFTPQQLAQCVRGILASPNAKRRGMSPSSL